MWSAEQFFKEHMDYVLNGEVERMVRETYQPDSVLYHNFPFFPGEAPYIARGHDEIIYHEKTIFAPENQGQITAGDPFNFVAREDMIAFQIIVTSPNTGRWLVTDCWFLREHKIQLYYAMGYLLEGPKK